MATVFMTLNQTSQQVSYSLPQNEFYGNSVKCSKRPFTYAKHSAVFDMCKLGGHTGQLGSATAFRGKALSEGDFKPLLER